MAMRTLLAPVFVLSALSSAGADSAAEVSANLESLPRPWEERLHRLTWEEYEATLDYWSEQHPGRMTLEEAGRSVEGTPIYRINVTDTSVESTDKQISLVVSLHGGPERSGTTAILHLIEWLLSDDPAAAVTRARQQVVLIPIVNPRAFFETDRFGNAHGIDPYTGSGKWDLNTLAFTELDKAPELAAFLSTVDKYRPEVVVDLHGVGLQEIPENQLGDRTMRGGHTMFEITGSAYSNYALRPWDWRVTEAMIAAGAEAGAGSDRFEADAQRSFFGEGMGPLANRTWMGRPRFYSAQYAYAKYHSMVMALEVGYQDAAVARVKALLDIGNTAWNGEHFPGYPVDRVHSFVGNFVTAWGTTAEERRRSRIELWNRQAAFSQAILYPQYDGRATFILATTPEAGKLIDRDPETFMNNLADVPGIDAAAIRAFVDSGPEVMVISSSGSGGEEAAIEHGLGIRLRIPYRNPQLLDVRLNGHAPEGDPRNGLQRWYGNGYTQLQIGIPPEAASKQTLFVVTCAYQPDQKRIFDWEPPQAVLDRLK